MLKVSRATWYDSDDLTYFLWLRDGSRAADVPSYLISASPLCDFKGLNLDQGRDGDWVVGTVNDPLALDSIPAAINCFLLSIGGSNFSVSVQSENELNEEKMSAEGIKRVK